MGLSSSFSANDSTSPERDLERYLDEALSRGGDYADLYFEYLATSNISVDESIVKSATQGVSLGVGVRVIPASGPATPTATTSARERFCKPPRVAACIAAGPAQVEKSPLAGRPPRATLPRDLPAPPTPPLPIASIW
jgi:TldD protein